MICVQELHALYCSLLLQHIDKQGSSTPQSNLVTMHSKLQTCLLSQVKPTAPNIRVDNEARPGL